jgi:hypothetical protein
LASTQTINSRSSIYLTHFSAPLQVMPLRLPWPQILLTPWLGPMAHKRLPLLSTHRHINTNHVAFYLWCH